jgi:mannose-1-phosphate guanylyltransferase
MLLPVIMAGGTGSRLWPMSRELYPKQFLRLHSVNSMLQETLLRLNNLEIREPVVICNEEHRFLVAEQLREIDKLSDNIILEPMGRNTAPAIALAALNAIRKGDDPVMLVLAADHVIHDVDAFHHAIQKAIPLAKNNSLVTFGIVATGPETGYGYIKRGDNLINENNAYHVECFVEKPNKKTAEEYISSGMYYWNSGMFVLRAKKYLEELEKFRPDILDACRAALSSQTVNTNFVTVDKDIFSNCPDESIDYAVMEKTHNAVVVPLDAGWSDVGSWSALWDVNDKDDHNNALSGDVFTHNTEDCYINTDEKLVAAVGIKNLVIVNTKDAVLVIDKSQVQDVKRVVEYLKENKRSEYRHHRDIYRPWGRCDLVVAEKRFNVNRITVRPGGSFSTQMHHHRAEHWIILSGTAKVTISDKTFLLTENQSTFIPIGAIHTLENPGKIPLELLEVRSGSYLGSDDVIRIKDHYGRS